jgi:choline dehydrogenase-like flavoprotein
MVELGARGPRNWPPGTLGEQDRCTSTDYIVVGAGSAGAALAARLSEDPRNRVLLVEAGRASHPYSRFPISFGLLINNASANWLYASEPEENTANRTIPVPRGKLLGGSSAINGLVWVRGQPLDYDTWAQMGARGWSWQDVAPLFRRIENYEKGAANGRGVGVRCTCRRYPTGTRSMMHCSRRRSPPATSSMPITTARTRRGWSRHRPVSGAGSA